ncbi:hypothetical protein F5880DRAFT_1563939 [Lentinula raphanica]|nr:hypothetical protein F5880DRAFT_1563939 [Lentinula raphanica]
MVSSSSVPSSSPASSSSASPMISLHNIRPTQSSPYLMQLLKLEISKPIIDYIVYYISHIVGQESVEQPITHHPMTRGRSSKRPPRQSKASDSPSSANATSFVKRVLRRASVTMAELLATLAYIDRARPYLQVSSDSKYPFERVFLGALIVASKFLNDSCLPNMHWAQCTRLFGKHDVGRIEREFLEVLDWELKLTEDDLLSHYDSLILATFPDAPEVSLPTTSTQCSTSEIPRVCGQERPHCVDEVGEGSLSFPSPAHQRSNTSQPTHLPLIIQLPSPSPISPIQSTSVSLPTPELEFDDNCSSFDSDSISSCSPPLLTPPSSLTTKDSDGGSRKSTGSFWYTFFTSMRIQEASSPIMRYQERCLS